MPDIRWTEAARYDLRAVEANIGRTSRLYARALVEHLETTLEGLEDPLAAGTAVPETDSDEVREVTRDGYRLIFRASDHALDVLAVLHRATPSRS